MVVKKLKSTDLFKLFTKFWFRIGTEKIAFGRSFLFLGFFKRIVWSLAWGSTR